MWDFTFEEFNSLKINADKIKDINSAEEAMTPLKFLFNFLQKNPFIKKPIKGNKGTKPTNLIINKI